MRTIGFALASNDSISPRDVIGRNLNDLVISRPRDTQICSPIERAVSVINPHSADVQSPIIWPVAVPVPEFQQRLMRRRAK